jgi:hypothetical protein
MSKFLFDVQQKNRLKQKGLLKRFSIVCYGHQQSVEEIRAEKAEKFKELKKNRDSREFEEWFLNYKPMTLQENTDNVNEEIKDSDKNVRKNKKKSNLVKKSFKISKIPNKSKKRKEKKNKTNKSKTSKKGFLNLY